MAPVADHEHNWRNLDDLPGNELWVQPGNWREKGRIAARQTAFCFSNKCTAVQVREEGSPGRTVIVAGEGIDCLQFYYPGVDIGRIVQKETIETWFPPLVSPPTARTE